MQSTTEGEKERKEEKKNKDITPAQGRKKSVSPMPINAFFEFFAISYTGLGEMNVRVWGQITFALLTTACSETDGSKGSGVVSFAGRCRVSPRSHSCALSGCWSQLS